MGVDLRELLRLDFEIHRLSCGVEPALASLSVTTTRSTYSPGAILRPNRKRPPVIRRCGSDALCGPAVQRLYMQKSPPDRGSSIFMSLESLRVTVSQPLHTLPLKWAGDSLNRRKLPGAPRYRFTVSNNMGKIRRDPFPAFHECLSDRRIDILIDYIASGGHER